MKKSILVSMLFASVASAGSIGPVTTPPSLLGFVSAEGGYTWNKVNGIDVDVFNGDDSLFSLSTNQKNQGGTARLAVGMLHPINDVLFLSGEIGWGYYGSTTSHFDVNGAVLENFPGNIDGVSLKNTLWGFDVLAGVVYNQPMYDLFFKAGGLMQNSQIKLSSGDFSDLTGGFLAGNAVVKVNNTEALPVIKLGASYHVWENLSVFAAWTHAFGSNEKINAEVDINAPSAFANVNLQNPTMDVVTGGLTFRFA